MKIRKLACALSVVSLFSMTAAAAHDCEHHGWSYYGGCADCDHYGHHGSWRGMPFRGPAGPDAAALRTMEGKIAEIIYLPGSTPGNGMVEIRLESDGHIDLVRLAPTGFLKQGGLRLREQETVTVKGFPVSGMEGDLLVASEIRSGDKTLVLRDGRGQPAW